MDYTYSIDLIKNPILKTKWENFKLRAKPNDLSDFLEIEKKGRNRVHKLYFKTIELEKAAKSYFNVAELEEDIAELPEEFYA